METSRFLMLKRRASCLLQWFFIFALLFVINGCTPLRIDGPYEGRVIDAETNQPIEGAVVHGTWSKRSISGAAVYYDAKEVLTDKNGEFKLRGKGVLVLSELEAISLTIFKAGYTQFRPNSWAGIMEGYMPKEVVSLQGNKAIFRLRRMALEERKKEGVTMPGTPNKKQKLFIKERNKEMIEIGRPSSCLLPEE